MFDRRHLVNVYGFWLSLVCCVSNMTLRNLLHFHTLKLSLLLFVKDLKFLSDDLEGWSPNPVSLLFDTLSNPDADLGREAASLLQWKHHPDKEISHVVLGKKEEGGIWQVRRFCHKEISHVVLGKKEEGGIWQVRHFCHKEISHVVLGKKEEGGIWQVRALLLRMV